MPSFKQLPAFDRRYYWLVAMPALVCLALNAGELTAPPAATVGVRLEWGGGAAEVWGGLVEVSRGRIENPRSLGMEADEPGTLWSDDGAVWVQRRTARVYDGFDVAVVAPPDAVLSVNLQAAGEQSPHERIEVRVLDLLDRPQIIPLGGDRRLVIRRTPGDALPVEIDRPHLVYSPGEVFQATVRLNLLDQKEKHVTATLSWRLTRARAGRALQHGSLSTAAIVNAAEPASVKLEIPLPREEGVYDIHLSAAGRGFDAVERQVQVVVIDSDRPAPPDATADDKERLIDAFDPSTAGLFRKITAPLSRTRIEAPLARWWTRGPAKDDPAGHSAANGARAWGAYHLKVQHLDRPHRLVVTTPADEAQALGISLIQPNAAGQVTPPGLDSGLVVSGAMGAAGLAGAAPPGLVQHKLVFWPRVRDPVLLLYALDLRKPVFVKNVELYEIGANLPARGRPPNEQSHRLAGPYMNKPLLPETFGADENFDPASQRGVDDWQTFYTAGSRLVEYLRYEAYNSLLLAALADGSAIYPSTLLDASPRYDSGVLSSAGQDPVRKDVLELLFQLFDREHLALIPELQFNTPLPALEKLASAHGAAAAGIQLVGRDGRTWVETNGADRGRAAWYNPLDPRVQAAIIDVVRECALRYRGHRSFRGLALELSHPGYLQLPGLDWGYDDQTIARFEQATGVHVPPATELHPQRHEFLTGKVADQWIRWRCNELARFHRRLAETVAATAPQAELVLAARRLTASAEGELPPAPALRPGGPEQFLTGMGLDLALYAAIPRLMLLRPMIEGAGDATLPPTVVEILNNSPAFDSACRTLNAGALLYQAPVEIRLPEFDAVCPWQPAQTWLTAQAATGGGESRKQFAHVLAAVDAQAVFAGGSMPLLGCEDETREIRQAIASLPAVRFQRSGPQPQPIVVRIAAAGEETYLYAVNDAALPVRVELTLSSPATTAVHRLGRDEAIELRPRDGNRAQLTISLRPYDVWCCRLHDPRAEVVDAKVVVAEAALARLAERVERLHEQMNVVEGAAKARATTLPNPGFELAGGSHRELPGWELPLKTATGWTLDGENPHSGKSALRLAGNTSNASLISPELPLDGCRFLTMTLWMRSEAPAASVRMSLDGELNGKAHRQEAMFEVTPQWRRYQFRVAHFPDGQLARPRIHIETLTRGRLWLDDVEVQSQRLTPDDLRQLTKMLSAVKLAWEDQRYADCQRLLDGYWGQFLLAQTAGEKSPAGTAPPEKDAAKPRMGERVRQLFKR